MSFLAKESKSVVNMGNIKEYSRIRWNQLKLAVSSFSYCMNNFHKFNNQISEHHRFVNAALIYQNTSDGIIITDKDHKIVGINQSFTQITGYDEQDAIGQNPRFLQSGKQNRQFYSELWSSLLKTGKWQGKIWNKRKNGEIYPELLTINTIKDSTGNITHHMGIFSDLSNMEDSDERMEHLAYHDYLTGLPNRLQLKERLNSELLCANKTGMSLALLFIDLDGFKKVNDEHGHDFGDTVLSMAANRLNHIKRSTDFLARVGGDEFVLIINQFHSQNIIPTIAEKIIAALKDPFYVDQHHINIGVSIGISVYPLYGDTPEALLKQADQAMYESKKCGRNNFTFYNPAILN